MAEPNASGSSAPSTSSNSASSSRGLKRALSMEVAPNDAKKTVADQGGSLFDSKTFSFVIDNVARLLEGNGVTVFSNMTTVSETQNFKVQLSFDPNPTAEKKAGFVEINLHLSKSTLVKRQSLEYKIAVLDNKGDEKFVKEGRQNIQSEVIFCEDPSLCVAKAAILDQKNSLIKNGQLKVSCEIRLGYNLMLNSQTQVCRDLEKLRKSGTFTDVTVIVEKKQTKERKEFPAHKAILSARSDVFAAMFNAKYVENLTNKVVIDDIEPNIFQELLNYIYYGQVSMDLQNVDNIFKAADKYEVMGLRGICEKFRSEHLKMEDVPDVIKFADTNSSNYLIQACTDFLSDNSKDITNSVWRKLPSDITFKVFKVLSKKAKVEEPKTPPSSRFRSSNQQNRPPPQRNLGANQPFRPNVDLNANRPGPNVLYAYQPPPVAFNNRPLYNNVFIDDLPNPANAQPPNNPPRLLPIYNYLRNAVNRQIVNQDAVVAAFEAAENLIDGGNENGNAGANVNPGANGNAVGNAGGGNDPGDNLNNLNNLLNFELDAAVVNPLLNRNANGNPPGPNPE
ncbi:hypothetical protein TYRP_017831 [Tyrophagus putrescentiae]|nr:hypothetical protein TYRP_017831 [Tyrophagus putrescentiae]